MQFTEKAKVPSQWGARDLSLNPRCGLHKLFSLSLLICCNDAVTKTVQSRMHQPVLQKISCYFTTLDPVQHGHMPPKPLQSKSFQLELEKEIIHILIFLMPIGKIALSRN